MKEKSIVLRATAGLVLLLALFVACTARPGDEPLAGNGPTPTQAPDQPVSSDDPTTTPGPREGEGDDVLIRDAVVTEIDVMMLESWPLQARAQIEGELGDGCTELGKITTERVGDTFYVAVKTTRPAEAVCTMELRFFSESVALDILGLEAGTYTVDANGVQETFTLAQDNVPQSEPEEPAGSAQLGDDEWSELMRLTLERALIAKEIPDYGLLQDPSQMVLSTEKIDPELVPEIEGVTLELLTPEEIQERADTQGDFLYLRFDSLEASSPQKATVALSNTWAVGADSDVAYLSGGGFTIEYIKGSQGWEGEITEMWIS
ncbi:MAG TPA: hypothetical protein VE553_06590 [Candidatus Binatia bacterium]|jgi:hypothetical protein|nr:hypothetical protein [Candidatus Binatia bacterium]